MKMKPILGKVLKDLRIEKTDLSQEKLAYKVGLHRGYIGAIERGQQSPSFEVVYKISRGLGVRMREISDRVEKEIRKKVMG